LLLLIQQNIKHTPIRTASISRPSNSGVACKGLSVGQEECVLDDEEEADELIH
jgi:hypothetical protein